jgi:hypothetical protein
MTLESQGYNRIGPVCLPLTIQPISSIGSTMSSMNSPARLLLFGLASVTLTQMAHAATDPRIILCAKSYTLVLKTGNGTIDIKDLRATPTLATLYKPGDKFELQGGREYALMLNESKDGYFTFDLQLAPSDPGSTWSFRIKTIPTAPYLSVVDQGWSQAPGKVVITMDRAKPLIAID